MLSIGAEPIDDGDADANSNLTVDFGLTPTLALGNLVWNDANDNGLVDSGETGVDGIPVQLFTGAGTPLGTTTTAGGGLYRFDYLTPGDYYVVITPTVGACSSSGGGLYEADPGAGQPPDPDSDIDNDDNGYGQGTCGQAGYSVRSSVVTLTIGGEPTGDGD
ncbi:MAG TPA: SdrD B-like domain-containing protein, partial [Anaerolineales bacterium]|nr:SdrD B-like domain-containing protein [Anaerolineales bacterium]